MTKILAVGGGSGGHVTPVVAVFKELQKLGEYQLVFWCDKKFVQRARSIFTHYDDTIAVETIVAGKFRRYHGMSRWHQLHPMILLPNIYDFLKVVVGFFQSLIKLIRLKPDAILIKGGYVCLPVGYAAKLLRIPMVLHDSDVHPGLTNRLLAPFAQMIGTGAPLEHYNYPAEKATYVGIPIGDDFREYSVTQRRDFKARMGFDPHRPLVVITGGGLGATRINEAVLRDREALLQEASVFLLSGKDQYEELSQRAEERDGWRLQAFVSRDMAKVLAAADVVVARAGATTLLELAALHKPTIIVPNGRLTAGHQLKNAKVYKDAHAAVVLTEEEMMNQPGSLSHNVSQLIRSPKLLQQLAHNFSRFAKPHAAADMAQMLITVIRRQGRRRR